MKNTNRTANIIATVSDLVSSFLYCDRKEDEDLPRGAIQEAVAQGEITPAEIVALFKAELDKSL